MRGFLLRLLRLGLDTGAGLTLNVAATAATSNQPKLAIALTALSAVFIASKSSTEYYLSPKDEDDATEALEKLIRRHGGLRQAIEAIAEGREIDNLLSPERAKELLALTHLDDDAPLTDSRQEELLIHIGRWLESWCIQHGEDIARFQAYFQDFADQTSAALRKIAEAVDANREESAAGRAKQEDLLVTILSRLPSHPNYDAEIDRANGLVKKRQFEAAIVLLTDLDNRTDLSNKQRFSVLKNLGHAFANGRDDQAKAAEYYRAAKACDPESEEALALELVVEFNVGNKETAATLVAQLLRRYPRSVLGHTINIRLLPQTIPFTDVLALIPEELRSNGDIALALAYRLATIDIGQAEQYARLATAATPDNPNALALLGEILLDSERRKIREHPDGKPIVADPDRLKEAELVISSAITAFGSGGDRKLVSHLHLCRGVAYQLLGRTADAEREYYAARIDGPDNAEAILQFAIFQQEQKNVSQAISNARIATEQEPISRAPVFLAQMLYDRDQPGDRSEAITTLDRLVPHLSALPLSLRIAAIELLVELLCREHQAQRSIELLHSLPAESIPTEIFASAEALTYRAMKDPTAEQAAALRAAEALFRSTSTEYVPFVAHALERAGLYDQAVRAWKSVVTPEEVGPYTYALIRCARKLHDDATILQICSQSREHHQYPLPLLDAELETLFKYSGLDRATEAYQQFLDNCSSDRDARTARVLYSMFAIGLGDYQLAEQDPSRLPSVTQVNVNEGEAVAHILGATGHARGAVDYAYELSRRFRVSKPAYRAVIRSFLFDVARNLELPRPSVVGADCAVCYREDDGPEQWRIIEDNAPDSSRGEIPSQSELARELWDKKPDDVIILHRGPLQDRTATITKVQHKALRRLNECLDGWQYEFPDDPFILRITIKKTPEGEPDFTPVFKSVDLREDRVRETESQCRRLNLPVVTFAQLMDGSTIDAFEYICIHRGLSVRSCIGTLEERKNATNILRHCSSLVATPSTLAVLYLTELFRRISTFPVQVLVPRAALSEIRRMHVEACTRSDEGGVMAKVQGRYMFIPTTREQVDFRRNRLSEFLSWIERTCTIVDGIEAAALPIEIRDNLLDGIGPGALAAIAIARKRGAVLWEEENNLGLLAANEFGVSRVWTQVLIGALCDFHGAPPELWTLATTSLLRHRFSYVSLNRTAATNAGTSCGWDPTVEPLFTLIESLSFPTIPLEDRAMYWLVLMRAVWESATIADAVRVTKATLNQFSKGPGGLGIVRGLLRSAYYVLRDGTAAARLWIVIYRWLYL